MIKDILNVHDFVCTFTKIDEDGIPHFIEVVTGDIVTTVGKNRAASQLANLGNLKTWFTHLALGTNDDAESTEDVALGAEIYRVALDGVAGDGGAGDLNIVFAVGETVFGRAVIQADSVDAGIITVKELGLLDSLIGGNLICRQVPNNELTFTGTEKLYILWGVIVN
ncbi:unnamed protein product [marine sediment metagenome]|uniref:Uncharacterized protein n=1 Tax=marine sediment metagenome TaxID=412755 RepID=X0ZZ64_9ZZZZ